MAEPHIEKHWSFVAGEHAEHRADRVVQVRRAPGGGHISVVACECGDNVEIHFHGDRALRVVDKK